jgi:hypothetical protein
MYVCALAISMRHFHLVPFGQSVDFKALCGSVHALLMNLFVP